MLWREADITPKLILRLTPYCTRERVRSQSELEASGYPHHTRYLYPHCSFDYLIGEWSKGSKAMNIQQALKPVAKVEVIGRPHVAGNLRASLQRGKKRLKAMLCAAALNESIVLVFCPELTFVPDGSGAQSARRAGRKLGRAA